MAVRRPSTRKTRSPRIRPVHGTGSDWPVRPEKLRTLEALFLDCDGVLTQGALTYDEAGKRSLTFDARDSVGIAFLAHSGLPIAVLSGRQVDIAEHRHKELGVRAFLGQCRDKAQGVLDLCKQLGVAPERCAFVGDDLPDLPGFRVVGVKIAVADAVPEVLSRADWVTEHKGGQGAVREVCETIMKARGAWQQLVTKLADG